jgi:hypothetical protein
MCADGASGAVCCGVLSAIARVAGGSGAGCDTGGAGAAAAAAGASTLGAGAGVARCETEPLVDGAGALATGSTNRVLTHSTVPHADNSNDARSALARRSEPARVASRALR